MSRFIADNPLCQSSNDRLTNSQFKSMVDDYRIASSLIATLDYSFELFTHRRLNLAVGAMFEMAIDYIVARHALDPGISIGVERIVDHFRSGLDLSRTNLSEDVEAQIRARNDVFHPLSYIGCINLDNLEG